jgi:threonine/homoserine/homoserine lactone efflux protein
MDVTTALLSFSVAAALLTVTPGLDTALVLRTATVEGPRPAMRAGAGIVSGVLTWGLIAALGLGSVLAMSQIAFQLVQIAGATYLIWLGQGMVRSAFRRQEHTFHTSTELPPTRNWYVSGLLTNLLNPKVGIFYVSFLPQFMPDGVSVILFSVVLAFIHAVMGLVFFATIVAATTPFQRALTQTRLPKLLDGITGTVMILFALRLLFEKKII